MWKPGVHSLKTKFPHGNTGRKIGLMFKQVISLFVFISLFSLPSISIHPHTTLFHVSLPLDLCLSFSQDLLINILTESQI